MKDNDILTIVKQEFERRIIQESLHRVEKCAGELTDEEFWHQPNENSNSVGNLVLHLAGNVKQYIVSGVGGHEDTRERDAEFDPKNIISKEKATARLKAVLLEANDQVKQLELDDLSSPRTVQGFEENVLSIIIHVIEHTSYHVGQITYYTKLVKNLDTGYYAGLNLNAKS